MKKTRITAAAWCVFTVIYLIRMDSVLALMLPAATAAVLAVCAFLTFCGGKDLRIRIAAPADAKYGDGAEIRIVITMENRSRIPVCRLRMQADCENLLTGEVCPVRITAGVGAKRETPLTVTIEPRYCGCLECRIEKIFVTDPFFLFQRERKISAAKRICVLPRIGDTVWDEEEFHAYDMESCRYSETRKGNDPSETFGIRVYEPGDSPRTVHWKLTGKLDELMVREQGLPVENSTAVLLDKRIAPGERLSPGQKSRAAEMAVSMSVSLSEHGIAHSFGWQDYGSGCFILRKIASEQDLWEAVSLLLSGGFREDPITTPMRCLESIQGGNFANYIYITAGDGADEERLEQYGAVKVYRVREDV